MAASSICVVVLWGVTCELSGFLMCIADSPPELVPATSLAPLLAFSLVLGLVAGGWTSLYSSIIRDAASAFQPDSPHPHPRSASLTCRRPEDDPQLATTLFGLVSFTRGVGSLLTAPVSSFLLNHPIDGASKATGFGIDHGKYASLVVFTGISLGKWF